MISLKIMEWNIHQKGRQYNADRSIDGAIPLWILEYITDDIDIVVFTEFNVHAKNILDFYQGLTLKGFRHTSTNYSCAWANDILIAVRSKNINVQSISYFNAYPDTPDTTIDISWDSIPENLRIDLIIRNVEVHLWGIRIKDLHGCYKQRKTEMETLMKWTKEVSENIVLIGDYNNLRDNTLEKEWNLNVLDSVIKERFYRKTPSNHSWGAKKDENNIDGYIKNDHLICSKDIIACVEEYDLSFMDRYQCSQKVDKYNKREIIIPDRYPDHGILTGTCFIFEDKDYEIVGDCFPNGGETFTNEELLNKLRDNLGYDKKIGILLIKRCVDLGFIYDAGNDCYTR
jgi:hypothetical protein